MTKMTNQNPIQAFQLGQMEENGMEHIANRLGIFSIDEINRIIASLNHIDQYGKSSTENIKKFFSKPRTAREIADLMSACNWLAYYWYIYQNSGDRYMRPYFNYAREATMYFNDCYNEMYEYVCSSKVTDKIAAEVFELID